jgi:hypothetical protein
MVLHKTKIAQWNVYHYSQPPIPWILQRPSCVIAVYDVLIWQHTLLSNQPGSEYHFWGFQKSSGLPSLHDVATKVLTISIDWTQIIPNHSPSTSTMQSQLSECRAGRQLRSVQAAPQVPLRYPPSPPSGWPFFSSKTQSLRPVVWSEYYFERKISHFLKNRFHFVWVYHK